MGAKQKKKNVSSVFKQLDKTVKNTIFIALFLVVVIAGVGIIQLFGTSYAQEDPVASLPSPITSKVEMLVAAGISQPAKSTFIPGITLVKRFYAVDSAGKDYDIYCLDRWLVQVGGVQYTKANEALQDKGMAYLLSQISPNNDNFLKGQSDDVKRYISQLTIWYYQDKKAGYSDTEDICSKPEWASNGCMNPNPDSAEDATTLYWSNSLLASEKAAIKSSSYWQAMNQVITEALQYTENNNYGITVDKNTVTYALTSDQNYIESSLISVQATGSNFLGYTIQTTNQNITFYDETGAVIPSGTTISPSKQFRFRIPLSEVHQAGKLSVHIQIHGSFSSRDAYMYYPESSEYQKALVGVMQLNPLDTSFTLSIEDPMGSARVTKIDATTGKPLAGATLVVKDANNKEVARWVSTTEAYYIDPLKAGSYTLVEEKAPEGYIQNTTPVSFEVEAGKTAVVTMENKSVSKVKITKTDLVTGKEVEGATLTIKDASGKKVATWVSTKEPHYIEALEDGTYTLTEEIAPEGYIRNTKTITFQVETGKTIAVTMENEPYGKGEFKKVSTTTGEIVPGATLVVTDTSGQELDRFLSSNTTHVLLLPKGTYILKEESAPSGYVKNNQPITFQIEAGKTTVVTMENEPYGEGEFHKVDTSTGDEVKGATLVITDTTGKEIDRFTSTTTAHVVSLPKGTYILTEISAPKGYVMSTSSTTFVVEPGKTTVVTMENEPYGKGEISKTDATTGEELPGATLVITDATGKEIDRWVSTTIPHKVSLPSGNYTLTETIAPEGYVVSTSSIDFTIEAGKTTQVEMKNIPEIDVPNTKTTIPISIYIGGIILSILGSGTIYFAFRKPRKQS